MGSPVSPLLADIVLDDLKSNCLKTLKNNFDCIPLFYCRQDDDILIYIKEEQLNTVLEVFNNYNSHLNFTHELETNNSINFVDLTLNTLIKSNNRIITNWYRKPSNCTRLLDYKSKFTTKRNIILNLVDRDITHSRKKFHSENSQKSFKNQ